MCHGRPLSLYLRPPAELARPISPKLASALSYDIHLRCWAEVSRGLRLNLDEIRLNVGQERPDSDSSSLPAADINPLEWTAAVAGLQLCY